MGFRDRLKRRIRINKSFESRALRRGAQLVVSPSKRLISMDIKKLKWFWMYAKMMVFTRLGMHSRIQNMYLNGEIEKKYSIGKLKRIVRSNVIPHNRRMAALRLYELGEKDLAINFLIEQMNLYKKPETPRQTICETCVNCAIALGRLKDDRAKPALIESLGSLPYFGASYALSLLNGRDTIAELQKYSSLETERGIHAAIALGFMGHDSALPLLTKILENKNSYDDKFNQSLASAGISFWAYQIIGLFDDNNAKKIFLSNLNDSFIDIFLFEYVHYVMFPQAYTVGNEVGWQITVKYGWDKYIDSDGARFACMSVFLDGWSRYFKTDCPFKTQEDVDSLRKTIRGKIRSALTNA